MSTFGHFRLWTSLESSPVSVKNSEYFHPQKVDPASFRGPRVLTVQVIHPTEDHLDCTDEICAFAVPHQPGRNL